MPNIIISPPMENYQNNSTLDSTDRNRTQSPTLTIIDLLNMNTSSISTNKLLITKKTQFQIRTLRNPRANNIKSPKFTKIYVNLSSSHLDISKTNLNPTRNLPKTETLVQEQPTSFKHKNLQNQSQNFMILTSNNHNLTSFNFHFNSKKRSELKLQIRSNPRCINLKQE